MDQSLRDAAQQGSIDALYALIQRDPNVLDRIDAIPFVETPLHTAAFAGHTWLAMEIMNLKPSFARKLNQDGFTPMHLALQKYHSLKNDDPVLQRNQTLLVHRLLDDDEDLVRVRGRMGVTPLHYVAEIGNLPLLTKFLQVCPKSVEDVTIQRENVLHIALKYDMDEAFQFLLRWIRRAWFKDAKLLEEKMLFWRDDECNTLLHVAVLKYKLEIVSLLMDTKLADLKAKNLVGDTVFDILERQTLTQVDRQRMRDRLRQGCFSRLIARVILPVRAPGCVKVRQVCEKFYARIHRQETVMTDERRNALERRFDQRLYVRIRRQETVMTDERRNALLVVAALLLTVTYQAALSAPAEPQKANRFNSTAPINPSSSPIFTHLFNSTAPLSAFWDAINASNTAIDKNVLNGNAFLLGNTITYFLTNVSLLFLVPPDFIGFGLYVLLVLLSFCYFTSTPLLNNPVIGPSGGVFVALILYLFVIVFRGKLVKRVPASFNIE